MGSKDERGSAKDVQPRVTSTLAVPGSHSPRKRSKTQSGRFAESAPPPSAQLRIAFFNVALAFAFHPDSIAHIRPALLFHKKRWTQTIDS